MVRSSLVLANLEYRRPCTCLSRVVLIAVARMEIGSLCRFHTLAENSIAEPRWRGSSPFMVCGVSRLSW